jgi:hypothetical protein
MNRVVKADQRVLGLVEGQSRGRVVCGWGGIGQNFYGPKAEMGFLCVFSVLANSTNRINGCIPLFRNSAALLVWVSVGPQRSAITLPTSDFATRAESVHASPFSISARQRAITANCLSATTLSIVYTFRQGSRSPSNGSARDRIRPFIYPRRLGTTRFDNNRRISDSRIWFPGGQGLLGGSGPGQHCFDSID